MVERPDEPSAPAKRAIAERKYDEAIRICRRTLLTQPDRVDIRLLLGQALLASNRYEQVRVEMMVLARKHPHLAEMHRILGESYFRAGQTEKATASLRRAVELDPGDQVARDLLKEVTNEDIAPVVSTIERWFAAEEEPTEVEAGIHPGSLDVPTPAVGPQLDGPSEPTIELAPELVADVAEMRSREALLEPAPAASSSSQVEEENAFVDASTSRRTLDDFGGEEEPTTRRTADDVDPTPPPMLAPRRSADDAPLDEVATRAAPVRRERKMTLVGGYAPDPSGDPSVAPSASSPGATRSAPGGIPPPPERAPPGRVPPPAAGAMLSRDPRGSPPPALSDRSLPPRPPRASPVDPAAPVDAASRARVAPADFLDVTPTGATAARSAPDDAPSGETMVREAPLSERPLEWTSPSIAGPTSRPPVLASATPVGTPRRRATTVRTIVLALVAISVIAGLSGVAARFALRQRADDAIRAAAELAGADGRSATVLRAISVIDEHGVDEPAHAALRARLLATLELEHAEDRGHEVEQALGSLEREAAQLPDARIARSLLLVAEGRGADALGVLSGLAASGDELAEAFRARALAAASAGRLTEAEESARQALSIRPLTPRHAALAAVLRAWTGDPGGALAVLDAVPDGARSPAVRVARARVMIENESQQVQAAADAEAVLGDLSSRATPIELGWAHLVRARLARARGDESAARTEGLAALERMPRSDETYGLAVVETLLAAGEIEPARSALERLPATSIDPPRRAGLAAEIAIAANDVETAERELIAAGGGAHADLLRGRVHEARGELEPARALYERAAADPREAPEARARAGDVLLRLGRAREARRQLEEALRLAPSHVGTAASFVRAALATGDAAAADAALTIALAQRPDAPALLVLRGPVLLALGRYEEAIAGLEEAILARPEDAELHAGLGEAAWRAGRLDRAGAAFTEAARLAPGMTAAHLGVARLAIEGARFDDADAALSRAETTGAEARALGHLRAELAVARGLGAAGVAPIEAQLAPRPNDAVLLAALGHLRAQSEDDREARRAFTRALRNERDSPEALLGSAGIETRRGDLGGAARSIERAERAARRRHLPASFMARALVARARLRFEISDFDGAVRLAQEALALDPKCGEAHVVIANVAIERDEDATPHFREAIAGTHVPAEAYGRLAIRLERGPEACRHARRYVEIAPAGYDREEVDAVLRRCR
jgi:tetratricopeptide (TPR) repeat protein